MKFLSMIAGIILSRSFHHTNIPYFLPRFLSTKTSEVKKYSYVTTYTVRAHRSHSGTIDTILNDLRKKQEKQDGYRFVSQNHTSDDTHVTYTVIEEWENKERHYSIGLLKYVWRDHRALQQLGNIHRVAYNRNAEKI